MAYTKNIKKLLKSHFTKDLSEKSYHQLFELKPGYLPRHKGAKVDATITGHMVISEPFLKHLDTTFKSRYPDFMYITWDTRGSQVVLIEIEKPTSRIFINNDTTFHSDFNKAIGQFYDWKDYFRENGVNYFKSNYLDKIYKRYSYSGHSENIIINYILIHGLRSEYSGNSKLHRQRASKLARREDHEGILVIPYDKLLDDDLENLEGKVKVCCQISSKFKIIKEIGSRTEEFSKSLKLL